MLSPPPPFIVRPSVLAVALAAALSPIVPAPAAPPDAAAPPAESELGIVAAAVRITGTRCDQPRDVERDASASRPDRPAWIIRCEDGLFRVIFEGDTGPRVTPLD